MLAGLLSLITQEGVPRSPYCIVLKSSHFIRHASLTLLILRSGQKIRYALLYSCTSVQVLTSDMSAHRTSALDWWRLTVLSASLRFSTSSSSSSPLFVYASRLWETRERAWKQKRKERGRNHVCAIAVPPTESQLVGHACVPVAAAAALFLNRFYNHRFYFHSSSTWGRFYPHLPATCTSHILSPKTPSRQALAMYCTGHRCLPFFPSPSPE